MNHVIVDGIVLRTWTYDHCLFARIAHATAGNADKPSDYFTLRFPATPVRVRETDAAGQALVREVVFGEGQADKVVRSQVVVITGRLVHRDERVTLTDFVARAKNGTGLTSSETKLLQRLAPQVGEENRGITSILVQEVAFL